MDNEGDDNILEGHNSNVAMAPEQWRYCYPMPARQSQKSQAGQIQ